MGDLPRLIDGLLAAAYPRSNREKIGKVIKLEDDWDNKVDRRCARILVELDVREGLFEEIIIKMHGSI